MDPSCLEELAANCTTWRQLCHAGIVQLESDRNKGNNKKD